MVSPCSSDAFPTRTELRFGYAVAGERVRTNRMCDLPSTSTAWTDAMVFFRVSEADNMPPTNGWLKVQDYRSPKAWLHPTGALAAIDDTALGAGEIAAQIRRVVPFMAALQGRIMLHAAAVVMGDQAVVIVGASGAGKSTLGHVLQARGYRCIADDLVPIRIVRGQPLVITLFEDAAEHVPVAALYFLRRCDGLRSALVAPLSSKECLRFLLRNGFGEVCHRKIWANQFRVYGQLANVYPAYELIMPNDLRNIAMHAAVVNSHFQELRRPR